MPPLIESAFREAFDAAGEKWPDMPAGSDGLDEIVRELIRAYLSHEAVLSVAAKAVWSGDSADDDEQQAFGVLQAIGAKGGAE